MPQHGGGGLMMHIEVAGDPKKMSLDSLETGERESDGSRPASDVLVLCPSHRDLRELKKVARQRPLRFHFHDYASLDLEILAAGLAGAGGIAEPRQEISDILDRFSGGKLHGVISSDDYPGSVMAAIVAQRLGLPGVSPVASLRCQHKYLSRLEQRRLVPAASPAFTLIDTRCPQTHGLHYPIFVKPLKSFFSIGASRVDAPAGLERAVREAILPPEFYRPFNELLGLYPQLAHAEIGARSVIGEVSLRGHQCTLEGYVRGGATHTVGVVDSIFYPGTRSFERFEYPSRLPADIVDRMEDIAARLMRGLEYGEGFFNVEFIVDLENESVQIVEVNPRLASQFADLYEKVDGSNSYDILLDLALGMPPERNKRAGAHRMAASCALRRFQDAWVRELPSEESLERLKRRFPDVRVEVLAEEGQLLSRSMQDGCSFRYAIVNIGGSDRDDVLRNLAECIKELRFDFADVRAPGKQATGG